MRKVVLALTVALSLAAPGTASAGCWATVELSSSPRGVAAGEPWVVDVEVLQHGHHPLEGAKPKVIVRSSAGERVEYAARATDVTGVYRARAVFPAAGRWSYAVYDGFPYGACAQTHSLGTVEVGPPGAASATRPPATEGESSPVWPVALGLAAVLLVAGGVLAVRYRPGILSWRPL